MKTLWPGLLLLAGCVAAQAQTTIASFTFESTTTPVIGAAVSGITWNSGGTEGYASVFSSQGQALSVGNFEAGEYYQVTLNTTGYQNIVLNSFRANGTTGAPKDWKISYSTTGTSGSFTDASSYSLTSSTAVGSTTITGISLSPAASNNTSIVLRFAATSATRIDLAGGAANGTVRLDNLSITGTAIPEPSTTAAILGVATLVGAIIRRRRSPGAT